jgi:hypothetical protein
LATPRKHKLASGRKSTRQNPDGKLITPVTDPDFFLRARGSFESTTVVYKPKKSPLKTKCHSEPSTSRSPLFDTKDLTSSRPEVRSEIHQSFPSIHKGKGPLESASTIDIPAFLRQNFPVSSDSKECVTHSFSTPKSMAVVGGGGGGAPGGGGGGQGKVPPPRVFAKVAARYAPLVLLVPLHDFPENYIKNLPKFTGEGDLTADEHINFFDQFIDICGIEHEDFYSRLRNNIFLAPLLGSEVTKSFPWENDIYFVESATP